MRWFTHKFCLFAFIALSVASAFATGCPAGPPCLDMNTQIKGSRLPSWGLDSGSANAYAITTIGDIGSGGVLQNGARFMFIATHANTSASTLAVDGGSAIAIKKNVSAALASGDIALNGVIEVTYDGTNFQIVGNGALSFANLSGSLACSQMPAGTGDVTWSSGTCTTSLGNIPTATTMAGYVLVTNIAAPSTPASGKLVYYGDSTKKVLASKNDAGTISYTVIDNAGSSHNFVTSIVGGVVTTAQVADSDLSISNITTNNSSTLAHGFLKQLDNNAAHYMDGTGAWSTPAGGGGGAGCGGVGNPGMCLIEEHTASASTELDFTSCISSSYDEYEIDGVGLVLSTTLQPQLQVHTGSGYDTGSNYRFSFHYNVTTNISGDASNNGTTFMGLRDVAMALDANGALDFRITFFHPAMAKYKHFFGNVSWDNSSGTAATETYQWAGIYKATTAVDGFRLLASTGNFTSGDMRCYGISK